MIRGLALVILGVAPTLAQVRVPIAPDTPAALSDTRWTVVIHPLGSLPHDGRATPIEALARALDAQTLPGAQLVVRLNSPSAACPGEPAFGADLTVCVRYTDGFELRADPATTHLDLIEEPTRSSARQVSEAAAWIGAQLEALHRRRLGGTPYATFDADSEAERALEGEPTFTVRGPAPGRVSVDYGPFRPLPLTLRADGRPHRLVVLVDGCVPAMRRQMFVSGTLRVGCAAGGGSQLTLTTTRPATQVLLRIGDSTAWARPVELDPSTALSAQVPDGAALEVECLSEGHLPWRRRWKAVVGRLDIRCDPTPSATAAIVTVDAPGPRFELDGRRTSVVEPLALDPHDAAATRGHTYLLTGLDPGPHQICADAPGHRRTCRGVWVRPGVGPTRLELFLRPRGALR